MQASGRCESRIAKTEAAENHKKITIPVIGTLVKGALVFPEGCPTPPPRRGVTNFEKQMCEIEF